MMDTRAGTHHLARPDTRPLLRKLHRPSILRVDPDPVRQLLVVDIVALFSPQSKPDVD